MYHIGTIQAINAINTEYAVLNRKLLKNLKKNFFENFFTAITFKVLLVEKGEKSDDKLQTELY